MNDPRGYTCAAGESAGNQPAASSVGAVRALSIAAQAAPIVAIVDSWLIDLLVQRFVGSSPLPRCSARRIRQKKIGDLR
jgi:hypothetical protein